MGLIVFLLVSALTYFIAVFAISYANAQDNVAFNTSKASEFSAFNISGLYAASSFKQRFIEVCNIHSFAAGSVTELCFELRQTYSKWEKDIKPSKLSEIIADTPELILSFVCNEAIYNLVNSDVKNTSIDKEKISQMRTITSSLEVVFEDEQHRVKFLQLSNRKLKAYSKFIKTTLEHHDNDATVQLLIEAVIALLFEGKITNKSFEDFLHALTKMQASQIQHLMDWVGNKYYLLLIKKYRCINEVRQHTNLNAEFFEQILKPLNAINEKHSPSVPNKAEVVVFEGYIAAWFIKMLLDLNRRRRLYN